MIVFQTLTAYLAHVFSNSIADDHGVVDGETDDREQRRDTVRSNSYLASISAPMVTKTSCDQSDDGAETKSHRICPKRNQM